MSKPMNCRYCGCTDDQGCPGGCCWVAPRVCSRCAALELTKLGLERQQGMYVPVALVRQMLLGLSATLAALAEAPLFTKRPVEHATENVTKAMAFYNYCVSQGLLPPPEQVCPELIPPDPNAPAPLWKPGDPIT